MSKPEGRGSFYIEVESLNGRWSTIDGRELPESAQIALKDVPPDRCVEIGLFILRYDDDTCDWTYDHADLIVHTLKDGLFIGKEESKLSDNAGADMCKFFNKELKKIDVEWPHQISEADERAYQADLEIDRQKDRRLEEERHPRQWPD